MIQSFKMRKFFDEVIPTDKILPFRSLKLDSAIWKWQNPPEPLEEWKTYIEGREEDAGTSFVRVN